MSSLVLRLRRKARDGARVVPVLPVRPLAGEQPEPSTRNLPTLPTTCLNARAITLGVSVPGN
jgi:hypothetical protein